MEIEDKPAVNKANNNLILPHNVPYVVEEISSTDRVIYAAGNIQMMDNAGQVNLILGSPAKLNVSNGLLQNVEGNDFGSSGTTLVQHSLNYDVEDSPFVQNSGENTPPDVVADSLVNEGGSPSLALPLLGNHPAAEVTPIIHTRNTVVVQDMRLVGAFWSEDKEEKDGAADHTPAD